jgi:hypothetical protein
MFMTKYEVFMSYARADTDQKQCLDCRLFVSHYLGNRPAGSDWYLIRPQQAPQLR